MKSSLLENVKETDNNVESIVTIIDEQITDQVVSGAKFVDQYLDKNENYWVLRRALLTCIHDIKSVLLQPIL